MNSWEEIDRNIDYRLSQHSAPVIEFARLGVCLGIPQGSWWSLTRYLPDDELPTLFRAGGSQCLMKSEASAWCKAWARKNPKRYGMEAA